MFEQLKEKMALAFIVLVELALPLLVVIGLFYGFAWGLTWFLNLIGFDITMASVKTFFGYTFLGFGGIGLIMFIGMASKGSGNISGLMLLPILGSGLMGLFFLII